MPLHHLGNRQSELASWEQGLRASEEPVEICRRLVAANPADFEPDLAGAVDNLGIRRV